MKKTLAILFSLPLLSLLVLKAWALTTDELGQHLIRMLNRGFTQDLLTDDEEKTLCRIVYKCATDWMANGSYATAAARKEAVRDIARGLFQARTGLDPATGSVSVGTSARHRYIRHWLQEDIQVPVSTILGVEDEN